MIQNINKLQPSQCTNIHEVRNEIDNIDRVIIDLLALRFEYVKEVVKYKADTPGSIEAPQRKLEVLKCRRNWAEEKGLDPDVVEAMYNNLIMYFIDEEKKLKNL